MYDNLFRLWLVKGELPILNERAANLLRAVWTQDSLDGVASQLQLPPEDVLERLSAMAETVGEELFRMEDAHGDRLILTPEGEMLLDEYDRKHNWTTRFLRYGPWPPITADGILFGSEGLLLVKRGHEPFKDMWALPGGFLEMGETVETTVMREMKEETGLDVKIVRIVGVFSKPNRDPRGHTVSVVYTIERADPMQQPSAGDDASAVRFFDPGDLPRLAFDHADIVARWREQEEPEEWN